MKRIAYLLFSLSSLWLSGQPEIDVRLYATTSTSQAIVTPDTGVYHLMALDAEGRFIDTIYDIFPQDPQRTFYLRVQQGKIRVKRGKEFLGLFPQVRFKGIHAEKEFRIEVQGKGRAYYGDLRFFSREEDLITVNQVALEKYVAGVVESEAGHVDQLEFYKAQAVLARTFALRNQHKHLKEGYNLKDDVSSQVYFSKAHFRNATLIDSAVAATRDTVIVLENCRPILSVFHANSGGYTVGAEDVWLNALPYLETRVDSFSCYGPSYRWEKRFPADKVYGYFARMLGVANDIHLKKALLNFNRSERLAHFSYAGKTLKMTRVRKDFGLKSTYFTIEPLEDGQLLLSGQGFGHGVGLSQDGAIEMAKRGYSYQQILHFYFSDIELESLQHIL